MSTPLDLLKLTELKVPTTFRWHTMDGRVLSLAEMETKHIFNSMKMCFNHLAQQFGEQPIWFNHQYSDYQQLALLILIFINEIEARNDLPDRYVEPYNMIKSQIIRRQLGNTVRLIETN